MTEERIKSALTEFPDATVVKLEDGYWKLVCSKCIGERFMSSDGWNDDVTILQDVCIRSTDNFKKVMEENGYPNFPSCDGRDNYILVK